MSAPDSRPQTPDPGPRTPSALRLLVRGTNWLGDAVMTTPALLRLREKFPDAQIALLTPEKLAELWADHPAVNETISFAPGESIFSVSKRLRAGGFNFVLVLPNSPRSAIETWLAGIPRRVGYARPWRNFFLTQAVAPLPGSVRMQKRSVAEIKTLIIPDSQTPDARSQPPPIKSTSICISSPRWARIQNPLRRNCSSPRAKLTLRRKNSDWRKSPARSSD